jgi:hypothetical protein
MARYFVTFKRGFWCGFHRVFDISRVFLTLILRERRKCVFSINVQKYIFLEGNQSRSHQIKSNWATFLLGEIASECPERRTAHGTSAPARTTCRQHHLIYRNNFREGRSTIRDREAPPHHPEQREKRSGEEEPPEIHSFSSTHLHSSQHHHRERNSKL